MLQLNDRAIQRGRSIQLVVAELGYLDESYLWRVFKSHYGVAPGAWREMFRANDRSRRTRPPGGEGRPPAK